MVKIILNKEKIGFDLPILASEEYLKIKSNNYGWLSDDRFILPFFIDKRLIFKRLVFTYSLIHLKENLTLEDKKDFMDNVIDKIRDEKNCDFIYKAQSNVIFNVCPKDSDCVPWGTYEIDLSLDDESLLKSFHGKHRNVIKKALKDGVIVEICDDYKLIYENIKTTLNRQNSIHYPSLEYLAKLKENIGKNILLLKATKDGDLQGTALIIYDDNRGYYMYGGSIPRPHTGSVNLLQFEAMKILKSKGIKIYDLVGARIKVESGSKYEGIQRFKSRFGANLIEGYAFRTIFNPIKYKLFNLVTTLYLKLKGYKYLDPITQLEEKK
ncbi:MAG: peptidoglycan bridge formation glycyltransferase FemA/FemB family protein [Campylobacterales bacterium]|nr:peptidoglycan bridge formation glycyltransferase FemA/FemB family protein [Campylobacterales bacterium]